ncbi:TPA: host cell division inhibitor Icd-like protein [Escherichia coli]|nr:host cell division inhibitor Icd-like protein [Escherichia coli]
MKRKQKHLDTLSRWLYDAGVAYMATRFDSLIHLAGSRLHSDMRFFCARNTTLPRIMAGRNGGAFALAGFQMTSLSTLLRLATPFDSVVARLLKIHLGALNMAVSTRPYFLWRFIVLNNGCTSGATVTATTEREARALIPASRLIFVARIRQGVNHA